MTHFLNCFVKFLQKIFLLFTDLIKVLYPFIKDANINQNLQIQNKFIFYSNKRYKKKGLRISFSQFGV
jgi:hypothetical protein